MPRATPFDRDVDESESSLGGSGSGYSQPGSSTWARKVTMAPLSADETLLADEARGAASEADGALLRKASETAVGIAVQPVLRARDFEFTGRPDVKASKIDAVPSMISHCIDSHTLKSLIAREDSEFPLLIFDLRPRAEFLKSRIDNAQGFPVDGIDVSSLKLLDLLKELDHVDDLHEWKLLDQAQLFTRAPHIVVYSEPKAADENVVIFLHGERVLVLDPNIRSFIDVFVKEGWQGEAYFLVNGFKTFATAYPECIDSQPTQIFKRMLAALGSSTPAVHIQDGASTSGTVSSKWGESTTASSVDGELILSDRGKSHRSSQRSSSSRFKSSKSNSKKDDWSLITDPEERRRVQNRIAQRKFRNKAKEAIARQEQNAENPAYSEWNSPVYPEVTEDVEEISGLPWATASLKGVVSEGRGTWPFRRDSRRGESHYEGHKQAGDVGGNGDDEEFDRFDHYYVGSPFNLDGTDNYPLKLEGLALSGEQITDRPSIENKAGEGATNFEALGGSNIEVNAGDLIMPPSVSISQPEVLQLTAPETKISQDIIGDFKAIKPTPSLIAPERAAQSVFIRFQAGLLDTQTGNSVSGRRRRPRRRGRQLPLFSHLYSLKLPPANIDKGDSGDVMVERIASGKRDFSEIPVIGSQPDNSTAKDDETQKQQVEDMFLPISSQMKTKTGKEAMKSESMVPAHEQSENHPDEVAEVEGFDEIIESEDSDAFGSGLSSDWKETISETKQTSKLPKNSFVHPISLDSSQHFISRSHASSTLRQQKVSKSIDDSIPIDLIEPDTPLVEDGISETRRLQWTCRCGHKSFDDFQELRKGGVEEFALDLLTSGYITHAQVTSQATVSTSRLAMGSNNLFIASQRKIDRLRSNLLPVFNTTPAPVSHNMPCLPSQDCRWLHMCLRKRPYATKLEPLHVCKDDDQKDFTDATFFNALRKAYYSQRSWRETLLFKLRKIEFVEFELCPDELVDHIAPNKLPPSIDEYDFHPPPPPKKCPPIGEAHFMHLFTSCSAPPLTTSLYLRHIPKRRNQALCFRPEKIEGNTGWGLNFVESLNGALAVTVMFGVSLILGIVFAVCWSIWKKDVQGAFGVAAYLTSVMTLAAMTWQMWAA